jgi:hypothetical protein
VNEFREFRNRFDKVGIDQISNPLRWFFSHFSSELDFENTIGEQFFFLAFNLLEWVINSEIRTTPISIRPVVAVKVVFSDHGKFGIERYTDASISR